MKIELLDTQLEEYIDLYTSKQSALLKDLDRKTWEQALMPRMLSGNVQGRLLSLLSNLIRPKSILEIGTYTGYSALCLAEGLAKDGELNTIEKNKELEDFIKSFFNRSDYKNQINLHIGSAKEVLPKIKINFDLVFIDADKENYCNYYDLVIDNVNTNGLIIADNVLWSGKVLDKSQKDLETETLRTYVAKVNKDPRVENLLLGIRDGLMIARKI